MDVIWYLLLLFVGGLFVGALARLALPGRDPMSIIQTALIGIAGSFAGGLLLWLVFDSRGGGSIVLSVAFATLIVYFIRRSRGGSITDPGLGPRG